MDFCRFILYTCHIFTQRTGGNKDEFRKQLIESVDFDVDLKEIEHVIESVSEEKQKEIDWTKLWSKMVDYLKKALIYGHTSRISS